jgi:CubicO group peptidase (beta-lactamase class C family)
MGSAARSKLVSNCSLQTGRRTQISKKLNMSLLWNHRLAISIVSFCRDTSQKIKKVLDDPDELGDNVAASYSFTLLGDITAPDPVRDAPINVIAPAGGMWSTLDDMARYVITQMNGGVTPDGARIVSEAALAATWRPQVDIPAEIPCFEGVSYGMGWVTGTYNGTPLRFHDGGWAGYRTAMAIFPDTQTGLIIFANHSLGDSFNYGLMFTFAEMLNDRDPSPLLDELNTRFETNFGNLDAQLAQLPPPEVERADVEPLLGRYERGWSVELRDDDLLWLVHPGWAFALRPLPRDNAYLIASGTVAGATVQFIPGGDAVATRVEIGGDTLTFAKTE